jgi:hypothetical protein
LVLRRPKSLKLLDEGNQSFTTKLHNNEIHILDERF